MYLIGHYRHFLSTYILLFLSNSLILFSVRIFQNSVVGYEFFFRRCAMELVSEKCIVSLLNRVVEV